MNLIAEYKMKFRGWLNGKRVVEGDPNKVRKNQILLVRDNSTGNVKAIRERGSNDSLEELIPDDYIYCRVKSWTDDLTNDGKKASLLSIGEYIGPLISSSLVNFLMFGNIYAPFDRINYNDGEGTNRYSKVKAIRIQKAGLYASENGSKFTKINTLDDLQNAMKLIGIEVDLSKALEPITKDEFDSMEVPTLPLA